jgi:hypothetical protein
MQTRDNNKKQVEEIRDLELENIAGNIPNCRVSSG